MAVVAAGAAPGPTPTWSHRIAFPQIETAVVAPPKKSQKEIDDIIVAHRRAAQENSKLDLEMKRASKEKPVSPERRDAVRQALAEATKRVHELKLSQKVLMELRKKIRLAEKASKKAKAAAKVNVKAPQRTVHIAAGAGGYAAARVAQRMQQPQRAGDAPFAPPSLYR